MIRDWNERKSLVGAVLFGVAFLYLYWIAGDVLRTAGDEGIYLEGGRRVAQGQQPYRDFFVFTGPLTFWIEGTLASWGGLNLAIMRLPAMLDAAFLAWVVYWFISRYTGAIYSAGTAIAYLAYESRPRLLNVNHRWDSAALATAAIALALAAHRTGRRRLWLAAGFLGVAAAWATPPVLLVTLPLLWWCTRRDRGSTFAFLGGGALAGIAGAAYLEWNHALGLMLRSMRWAGANYTAANRVPYGSVWLGTAALGLQPVGLSFTLTTAYTLISAVLPPAALAGWAWYLWRGDHGKNTEIPPLVAAAVALVLSAWPRWTADALLHTAALSWFLCALLLYRVSTARSRLWLGGAVVLAAGFSLAGKSIEALNYLPRETRVGIVRTTGDDSEVLAAMERRIQPGDSLFSFPYTASLYYLLNVRNPSRYTFLQPGMMTGEDELHALADLQAAPPRWVVYESYPPQVVLALWPGSDPARIPMAAINFYLREQYRPVDDVTGEWGHLVIMENASQAGHEPK
jgi:hypothetical protein